MSKVQWLVELRRGNMPALFLYGDTVESIGEAVLAADDYYGEPDTKERMAKCWTDNALHAYRYTEEGAKHTATSLDRCCGGIAVAVDHMFIDVDPNVQGVAPAEGGSPQAQS